LVSSTCRLLSWDLWLTALALNKPTGISSAQALRDLQSHFDPSKLFGPWLALEKSNREREARNQQNRRKMKQIKVKIGHGGTLDPLATGVLIAGVGKGTKILQSFLECTKTYETIIIFGASTDSYDRVGKILKRAPYQHITKEMVEQALGQFRGKIMQLPPLYSALKMDGKPLYEYAREGKQIPREIQKRAVEVQELELLEWMPGGTHPHKLPTEQVGLPELKVVEKLWSIVREADAKEAKTKSEEIAEEDLAEKKRKLEEAQDELVKDQPASKRRATVTESEAEPTMSGGLATNPESSEKSFQGEGSEDLGPPAVKIRMTVTSGFYVRSLAHDLGEAIGSQAIMAELIRTRQGQFELGKNVLEYTDLAKGEDVWGPQVEGYLDEFSAEYKPLLGKATEVKVQLGESSELKVASEDSLSQTKSQPEGDLKET
jgi:tRNA pseudouridine55 synthase